MTVKKAGCIVQECFNLDKLEPSTTVILNNDIVEDETGGEGDNGQLLAILAWHTNILSTRTQYVISQFLI